MRKLVVTGALGHIGSSYIRSIPESKYDEVVLIDNIVTQRYPSLFNLPKAIPYRFIEEDIIDANLSKLFSGASTVVHLAAITDAANSFEKRDEVMKVNLEGTRKVAHACIAAGARLLFPSTTSVYGVQESTVDEECKALAPQSPYAESKLAAENLLTAMFREKRLDCRILRLGTIFGVSPGMRFHTAINRFCWQACLGSPITVWSTALNQDRPYLDLRDAVALLNFAVDMKDVPEPLFNAVTVNASVNQIVDTIKRCIDDVEIQLTDSKIMNQLSYRVTATRLTDLGFHFNGDLEQGIRETIQHLRALRPALISD